MASTFTAAAVAIPTFTGLKVESGKAAASSSYISMIPSKVSSGGARASVSTTKTEMRKALVAATVSVGVLMGAAAGVGNANAIEVLMGSSGGELVFIPKEFQVGPGEPITFKNNAGFPHNIIFDEDDVPPGVDVNSISMSEEDLLNAPGETYTVKLDKKGSYRFYCSPHQGSGMSGKVVVE